MREVEGGLAVLRRPVGHGHHARLRLFGFTEDTWDVSRSMNDAQHDDLIVRITVENHVTTNDRATHA